MSCSPHTFLLLKFLIPVCFIIATSYYLFHSHLPPLSDSIAKLPGQIDHLYDVAVSGKKSAFVEQVLETDIDIPFDKAPLSELCSKKDWVPGLIFKCDPPQGGVGNVRNVFLNCFRYAIEAGGEFSVALGPHLAYLSWIIADSVNSSNLLDRPRNRSSRCSAHRAHH